MSLHRSSCCHWVCSMRRDLHIVAQNSRLAIDVMLYNQTTALCHIRALVLTKPLKLDNLYRSLRRWLLENVEILSGQPAKGSITETAQMEYNPTFKVKYLIMHMIFAMETINISQEDTEDQSSWNEKRLWNGEYYCYC